MCASSISVLQAPEVHLARAKLFVQFRDCSGANNATRNNAKHGFRNVWRLSVTVGTTASSTMSLKSPIWLSFRGSPAMRTINSQGSKSGSMRLRV